MSTHNILSLNHPQLPSLSVPLGYGQPLSRAQSWALCLKVPLGPYIIYHVSKQQRLLRDCSGSPEPPLFAYVITTLFTWAGSIMCTTIIIEPLHKKTCLWGIVTR